MTDSSPYFAPFSGPYLNAPFEFFTVCTKLAEMAILYSKDLTTAKKKLPAVGLDLMLQIITGLGVQCLNHMS